MQQKILHKNNIHLENRSNLMCFFSKILSWGLFVWRFLKYALVSRYNWGYGIHSPFVYDFHRNVLNASEKYPKLRQIRRIRRQFKKKKHVFYTADPGAGSPKNGLRKITLREATTQMAVPHRYGKVLHRLVHYYSANQILELGTGVGVSTLYLALGHREATIHTIEGSPEKAAIANDLFQAAGLENITLWNADFDHLLPKVLNTMKAPPDLVFIDGNHKKDSTLKYIEQILPCLHNNSIIVLDDIYWSSGMNQAWKQIQQNSGVTVTIDIFRMGIVFIKKELSPQNFIIRY